MYARLVRRETGVRRVLAVHSSAGSGVLLVCTPLCVCVCADCRYACRMGAGACRPSVGSPSQCIFSVVNTTTGGTASLLRSSRVLLTLAARTHSLKLSLSHSLPLSLSLFLFFSTHLLAHSFALTPCVCVCVCVFVWVGGWVGG